MSVDTHITVFIMAKTKEAVFAATKRLLDAAYPDKTDEFEQWHREHFEKGLSKPEHFKSFWHVDFTTYCHLAAASSVWGAVDGLNTDDYVVYAEMPDGDFVCPAIGIHYETKWININTEAAYDWLDANYHSPVDSHQPSQEKE